MLVLSRREGERVFIGDSIVVQLVEVRGQRARLGIEAPPDVSITREETSAFGARVPTVPDHRPTRKEDSRTIHARRGLPFMAIC